MLHSVLPLSSLALGLLGTILIALFYVAVWVFSGISVHKGAIVVCYEPPQGMSPAAIRYLRARGFDERGFSAAILSLAAKQAISLEQRDAGFLISPGEGDSAGLTDDERAFVEALLPRGFALELNQESHERVYTAIRALKLALDRQMEKTFLNSHHTPLIAGLFASVALFAYLVLTEGFSNPFQVAFLSFFVVIFSLVDAVLLLYVAHLFRARNFLMHRPGDSPGGIATTISMAALFVAVDLGVLAFLVWASSAWYAGLLFINIAMIPVAHVALTAPTKSGRALLAQIEGFRKFLSEVESGPMALMHRDEKTPALFEKYLPYAFALDVEDQWARHFEDVAASDAVGALEGPAESLSSDWATLDLTAFGIFVQKWFPFELGEIKISVGPSNSF